MSSYLDNLKSYSHCPLKKRPLCIVNMDLINDCNDDQPQDLRVKRRKESDDITQVPRYPSSPPAKTSGSSTIGPVLESSTTYVPPPPYPTPSTHVPPPRVSPPPSYDASSKTCLPEPRIPPLADFYLQLFQSTAYQKQQQQHMSSPWDNVWSVLPCNGWNSIARPDARVLPAPSSVSPVDTRLSSPRSTSSEDSGIGCEAISEDDEIDVCTDSGSDCGSQPVNRHCCNSCGKSYSTPSGLRKHMEVHCSSLPSRTFECKHCSKSYNSVGALKMHVRTHTLPCKCHVCGKAFSRPWLLQGHIRTHTGEKPFECQQCHRSFADRSNLRAHQQTHERVKKYACQNCNKTFSRMSLLSKHSENSCPRATHISASS